MDRIAELRRVLQGPLPGEVSDRLLLRVTFAAADPRSVIALARDVMAKVLDPGTQWPGVEQWQERLSPGFAVGSWLDHFDPDGDGDTRGWTWWDAAVDGPGKGWIDVEVDDHSFGWDSLEWLLTMSGASDLES